MVNRSEFNRAAFAGDVEAEIERLRNRSSPGFHVGAARPLSCGYPTVEAFFESLRTPPRPIDRLLAMCRNHAPEVRQALGLRR